MATLDLPETRLFRVFFSHYSPPLSPVFLGSDFEEREETAGCFVQKSFAHRLLRLDGGMPRAERAVYDGYRWHFPR